jgi:hypothetical protein
VDENIHQVLIYAQVLYFWLTIGLCIMTAGAVIGIACLLRINTTLKELARKFEELPAVMFSMSSIAGGMKEPKTEP